MGQREEAASLAAETAERMEGLAKEARKHAEAGRLEEAMAVLAVVEEGARTTAEGLARWLGAKEDLACVRAAILADVHGVMDP